MKTLLKLDAQMWGALGLFLFAFLAPAIGFAQNTTLEYELPTQDCAGQSIEVSELAALEIYISAAPIPASDVNCAMTPEQVDTPPDSFSEVIQTGDLTGAVTIDLFPGPYHARARVQNTEGEWSNFSPEIQLTVPGPLRPPVILRWNLGG